ncbi:divalent-cation tolerance protein CutA [Magnetospira sp. QH-2]|uniref:divalent-cation tolerance protein CutA n=1 Tax=Magnetospira sp. (strain QH-2) TaxID=1288970 RepID=UPI0003E80E24|nr:divalent-cation tolerance protein CutA [Magnetospira sp. QH-2]CCQ73809.1 Divalent-cation tolerance protein cutA [Magnetospira sp. QH-2]
MPQLLIYITASSPDEALAIGETLVGERLAACVNILPGMISMYWWQGEVQQDEECVLIAKTRDTQVESLIARVKELHSYDCPCVVALPIEKGNPAFLQWIDEQTG